MRKALLLSLAFVFALGGCAQIRVHRASETAKLSEKKEETFRTAAFGLRNLSYPVDLRYQCGKEDWEVVTTEKTFSQALLSVVTLNLYSPWTIGVECRKP